MNLKTQVQITSLIKREHLMKAVGRSVAVEFGEGPLGLQLADVGRRVLVTAFEGPPEGGPGQAEASGKIEVGNQVVAIQGHSTLGLSMMAMLKMLAQAGRPVTVDFQPLIIPHYPARDRETIFARLGPNGRLEETGDSPFEVEFPNKLLGLTVGDVSGMVVVSQFVDGGDPALLQRVDLGDRLRYVSVRLKATGDDADWERRDCAGLDYAEVAALVRDAGRPVRIGFSRTQVVKPPVPPAATLQLQEATMGPKKKKKKKKPKRRPKGAPLPRKACSSCNEPNPGIARFCWSCGERFEEEKPAAQEEAAAADLIGLGTEEDETQAVAEKAPPAGVAENDEGVEADDTLDIFA